MLLDLALLRPTVSIKPSNVGSKPVHARSLVVTSCRQQTTTGFANAGSKRQYARDINRAPWRSYQPARAPDPALLTKLVVLAEGIDELLDLFTAHRSQFDAIHLAAFASRVAKLAPATVVDLTSALQQHPVPELQLTCNGSLQILLPQLLHALHASILQMRSRQTVNILWSLSKIATPIKRNHAHAEQQEATAHNALLPSLIDHFHHHASMHDVSAQDLAQGLYAIAMLKPDLNPDTIPLLLDELKRHFPRFKPQDWSMSAYAIVLLNHRPPDAWLHSYIDCSCTSLHKFSAQALTNTVWALSQLGWIPSQPWQSAFLAATEVQLPAMYNSELATIAWAMSRLQMAPGPAWLAGFEEQVARRVPLLNGQQVADLLQSMAALGHRPHRDALISMVSTAQQHAAGPQGLSPRTACNLMWALAQMDVVPPASLMAALLKAIDAKLKLFQPAELSTLVHSLALLRHLPDLKFMMRLLHCVRVQLSGFNARQLANTLYGLAKMGVRPDRRFMQWALLEVMQLLDGGGFTSQELANLLWAIARISYRPTSQWLAAFYKVTTPRLAGMKPDELAMLVDAAARAQLRPSAAWVAAAYAAVGAQVQDFGHYQLWSALRALAHLERLASKTQGKARRAGLGKAGNSSKMNSAREAVSLAADDVMDQSIIEAYSIASLWLLADPKQRQWRRRWHQRHAKATDHALHGAAPAIDSQA